MKTHHLIFEGCELVGKSYIMAQVYNYLEKKFNQKNKILDGCHWINCDVGVFGGKHGRFFIKKYIEILKELKDENIIFEKFHISEIIYQRMLHDKKVSYKREEQELIKLGVKIIFLRVEPSEELFTARLKDRLALYPHYKRIAKNPDWYIKQQEEYTKEMKKTKLPYLEIDVTKLPTNNWKKIISWLK
jgi:thymidylate kinase